MIRQNASGSSSATTQSAISPGTINITNGTNQTQALATLDRNTNNLNGSVAQTPDLQNLLAQQSDLMNAAQAAGQKRFG
jgi:filamentous hemagglutinin